MKYFVANYIDDFLIYSETVEEHYEHLKVFAALCLEHGIGLSGDPKKFQVCQKEIEFLGVVIRNGKIYMQPHVIEKISNFPDKLESKEQCMRFLGCVNYVSKHISHLSDKTVQIRKCKNSSPFKWTKEASEEVRQLQRECRNLPPLEPMFKGPYILNTDASYEAWGAVLLKAGKSRDEEKICSYASGSFAQNELNYLRY